jgi:hypothetical protein
MTKQTGSARKPKFRVGQRVWSKMHNRMVTIKEVVWDRDHSLHGYFLEGLPMYWLEYNLRIRRWRS